jgi:Ca2+-binding RTX toxin-like protein
MAINGTGNGADNYIYGSSAAAGVTLNGAAGADYIVGSAYDDVIAGGIGNDNMVGNGGNDGYLFAAGSGNDTIQDFDSDPVNGQDFIDVSGRGFSAASIGGAIVISGNTSAVVTIGADIIVLTGVNASTISASDFHF